jgi:hypothetical protein
MTAQKTIKWTVFLVIIANLVILVVVFLGAPANAPKTMPKPNGFDDFVRAGQLVSGTGGLSDNSSLEDLRKLVAQNSEVMGWVRKGLAKESRIPEENSMNQDRVTNLILGSFKQLALALEAEGRLAETEQRTNEAAEIYLEAAHFAQNCTRGGVIFWKLQGVAYESTALKNLERISPALDAPESRRVAGALEKMDANEETVEESLGNEKNWVKKTFGLRGQIQLLLAPGLVEAGRKSFVKKYQANQLRRRELILACATRAYALEKGQPPRSAFALLPDYLKALPTNPFTGTNMVRRAQPE